MKKTLIAALVVSVAGGAAIANQGQGPRRPDTAVLEDVVNSMGISTHSLDQCMHTLHGSMKPKRGEEPSLGMQAKSDGTLSSCLSQTNEGLRRTDFDSAIRQMPKPGEKRPGNKKRGGGV